MTLDQVTKLQNAIPFEPFEILLADGRALPIGHPDFLGTTPAGRIIVVFQEPDTTELIDLLLVISLRYPPHARAAFPASK